jgi:hypothetical protein
MKNTEDRHGLQGDSHVHQQVAIAELLRQNFRDRADIESVWPSLPVLMFAGVRLQTPFILRFFDAYLRHAELPAGDPLQDLVG